MMKKLVTSTLFASSMLAASAGAAFATEGDYSSLAQTSLPAVTDAIEIGVAGGYAQGTGDLGTGMADLSDLSGAGGAVELQLGYRIIPHLTLGVYGSFSSYSDGDLIEQPTDVLGAAAGIRADWHFLPAASFDPWVSLGTGWRGLWLQPDEGGNSDLQGFEIARVQLGVDYRISPEIAITPVIGTSVTMYTQQDGPTTDGYQSIDDPDAQLYFFGGLMGRFDLGGTHVR
jgi:hypothetical protein